MRGDHSALACRAFAARRRCAANSAAACAIALFIVFPPAVMAADRAADAPVLTERRAVDMALSRPVYRDLEAARLDVADSALTEAGLPPNPVFSWEQSRTGRPAGSSTESNAKISQTFDFSGRRALRREAAGMRVDAARFDQQDRRLATIIEVRRVFGEALHRQETRDAMLRWLQRVDGVTEIVGKLARAGEASGYDRRRLEREAQGARARAAAVAADYARTREALVGLIGEAGVQNAPLQGQLLPAAVPNLEAVQSALRRRPDLASLAAQADAYDRERSAAERAWIPDVTLGVGQKRIDELGRTDNGVIVGFSLPLPLFERGQAGRQRAQARAGTLRAEQALSFARAEAELRGVWRQAAELRQAAATFRAASLASSRELTRIAEAAYRAGEGNILELLDAYRADLEAETTSLDLALRARLAGIELNALSGESSHE